MNTKARVVSIIGVSITLILLASCRVPLALWVVPGSTADTLVLGFSESRKSKDKIKPSSIKVFPCDSIKGSKDLKEILSRDESAVWIAIVPSGVNPLATNRITYGRDEFGLQTQRGPQPLAASGCYFAVATARDESYYPALAAFNIDKDGKVLELRGKEYDKIFIK